MEHIIYLIGKILRILLKIILYFTVTSRLSNSKKKRVIFVLFKESTTKHINCIVVLNYCFVSYK